MTKKLMDALNPLLCGGAWTIFTSSHGVTPPATTSITCEDFEFLVKSATELTALQKEVDSKWRELLTHREMAKGNYWAWQGGDDNLESLVCPVGMRPEQLKAILDERDSLCKQNAELKDALARSDFLAKERLEYWKNCVESFETAEAANAENIKKIATMQQELGKLKTDYRLVRKQNAELREALIKCRNAITGYKDTNVLHPESVLALALDAASQALATQPEVTQ